MLPVLIGGQVTALQKQQAVAREQATNRAGSGCSSAWRDKGPATSDPPAGDTRRSAGCHKAFLKNTVNNANIGGHNK